MLPPSYSTLGRHWVWQTYLTLPAHLSVLLPGVISLPPPQAPCDLSEVAAPVCSGLSETIALQGHQALLVCVLFYIQQL